MEKTVIYFIRHSEQLKFEGEYYSKENEQIKNEKIVLSIAGEEKAKKLSELDELKNIDVIYSSNYVRAIGTAKYIANENNLKINIDERLGERKQGDLIEAEKLIKDTKKNYTVNQIINPDMKALFGESNLDVRKRMLEFMNDTLREHKGKRIAVVSHGAAIKFLLQNWCEYDEGIDGFNFENEFVFPQKITSPSVLKLKFKGENLIGLEYFS